MSDEFNPVTAESKNDRATLRHMLEVACAPYHHSFVISVLGEMLRDERDEAAKTNAEMTRLRNEGGGGVGYDKSRVEARKLRGKTNRQRAPGAFRRWGLRHTMEPSHRRSAP